jgi:hypothetical protein
MKIFIYMIFDIKSNVKRIDKMGGQIRISDEDIINVINLYNNFVYGKEERATTNQGGRDYGRVIRAEKERPIANKLKEARKY